MSGRTLQDLRAEAQAAMARNDVVRARSALFTGLGHMVAREDEYAAVANETRNLLAKMGDARGALTADWYAGSDRTQRPLLERVPPVDRARTYLAWAERDKDPARAQAMFSRAADEYESATLIARAAVCRERAEDFGRARALWSRLAHVLSGSGADYYAAGLARFNLARTSKRTGDAAAAREATVGAVHLLEEAADRYETIGQRERAFDCFQVLIAIGKDSGEFEHVLEGYVNVIRILREDNLRYYALQSYEEVIAVAEKQGETAAAATLAREMAWYARKEALGAMANFGVLTEARLWREVARLSLSRGSPPELSENALQAGVLAYGEAGQFAKVAELYGELAGLSLVESRRSHYQRASARYAGASDLRIEAAPLAKHLRHETGYPDVWHVDLVEWEQHGSASEVCADIILEDTPRSEVTRRRAVVARLTALALETHLATSSPPDASTTANLAVALAEQLAQLELYTILSPLEHLFQRQEPGVRVAVLRALSRFLFKRTFITLREGLAASDASISAEAAKSLEELRFPHAFDPLARIYRESTQLVARQSVLRALAKIDTLEVAEMLLGVIEHDGREERSAAVEALKKARGVKFVELARSQAQRLSGHAATAVREIFQARGIQG